eukprot:403335575
MQNLPTEQSYRSNQQSKDKQSSEKPIILITGITGYIGSWIGKYFLANLTEKYNIRATVRSLKKCQGHLDSLRSDYGTEAFNKIEFVEADLNDSQQMRNAVYGCTYVIHSASPTYGVDLKLNQEYMMNSNLIGTQAVLDAALQNKVKRVVITSHLGNMIGQNHKRQKLQTQTLYHEKDYSPILNNHHSIISKIAQEQLIRDFMVYQDTQLQEGDHKVDIITLHPSITVGPSIVKRISSFRSVVAKFIMNTYSAIPNLTLPFVDVRDVALAHLMALKIDNIPEKRIIISQESLSILDLAHLLRFELSPHGYQIRTRRLSYCMLKLASLFSEPARAAIPFFLSEIHAENTLSKKCLGLDYQRDLKKSFIEMAYSMIEKGIIQDLRKK